MKVGVEVDGYLLFTRVAAVCRRHVRRYSMSKPIKFRTAWHTCRAVLLWLAFLGLVAGCDLGDSGENTPPGSGNDIADASDASDPTDDPLAIG